MVVVKQKPMSEILKMVSPFSKILVLGCNTCTAVCSAGGRKEVSLMVSALKLKFSEKEFMGEAVKRQCEWKFVDGVSDFVKRADVVLSLGCGVGVQAVAELFPDKEVLPGNNTLFLGSSYIPGEFSERCVACGNCLLHLTGGLCPLSRCPKKLLNGPCGGVRSNSCELSPSLPCIWVRIIERMEGLGKLYLLDEVQPPPDWASQEAVGPRKLVLESFEG